MENWVIFCSADCCGLAEFQLILHGISEDVVFRNSYQVVKSGGYNYAFKVTMMFDYSSKNGQLYKLISLQIICSMFIHG